MKKVFLLILAMFMLVLLLLPSVLSAEETDNRERDPLVSPADGSTIMYENRKVADVEASFENLTRRGEWMGIYLGMKPQPSNQLEIFPPPFDHHIQGMARSPRVGQAPVFYFSVSGTPQDDNSYPALLVVQMGSRAYYGERLGSNRLQQGKETTSTYPDPGFGRDRVAKVIEYPDQWHPSGISMVGDILAVPAGISRENRPNTGDAMVMFYDCSDPLNPLEMPEYELLLKGGENAHKLFTLTPDREGVLTVRTVVSPMLIEEFEDLGGIILGGDATIKMYSPESWMITDGDVKYVIIKEGDPGELNVYYAWEKPLILDHAYESEFDTGEVTQDLQEALATVHVHVDVNVPIMTVGNDEWFIADDTNPDHFYTIVKKEKFLRVYGAPAKPPWPGGGQAAAITRLPATTEYPDGRYLLVRNTGKKAHYHWSNQGTFSDGLMWTDYQELSTVPRDDLTVNPPAPLPDLVDLLSQGYWQDSKPRFQNLTFVDQADGGLYLIGALNTEDFSPAITMFGDDKLHLIELHNQDQPGNLTMTAASDAEKELYSPGKKKRRSWALRRKFEDRWYFFTEDWVSWSVPDWLMLIVSPILPDITIEIDAVKPMSKRTQGNFNAGATAYVTPSGELLYYGVHHWADGNPGNGWKPWTLHGSDEFESQDFVKLAELSHEEVSADGKCGDPLFRENHLGGPYSVMDPSNGVGLYGEVYSVEPWVRMYENDYWTGHMVIVDYDTQDDDDYDIFKYLDGAFNECRERYHDDWRGGWDGFSNCMSSYRWCGPEDSNLTFFDSTRHQPCTKGSCKDDLSKDGNGEVFSESLKGKSFKEEADSVLLKWTPPPEESYAWEVTTGDGSFVADCRNPGMIHYYPGLNSTTDTVQLTYTRDIAEHVFTADVTSDPLDPGFIYLSFDNPCPETGQQIKLDGAWNISATGPVTPTVSIDWGDLSTAEQVESPPTDGHTDPYRGTFTFDHYYANFGTYTVKVCADGTFGNFCDDHVFDVKKAPFTLLPNGDREIDEGGLVWGLLALHYEPEANIVSATVDWGDNTGEMPATYSAHEDTGGYIFGNHHYADDGVYRALVCVELDDQSTYCATFVNTVNSVAPSGLEAGTDRAVGEGEFMQIGPLSFSDPGFDCTECDPQTVESFTGTVDWGDGTTESVEDLVITKTPGGADVETTGTIQASHHYADNGTYNIRVCVQDDDLEEICDTFEVVVENVQPNMEAGEDRIVFEGDVNTFDLGSFSDPGFDCELCGTLEDFEATVDWGDGTTSMVPETTVVESFGSEGVETTGTIAANHQYLMPPGVYTITVCVVDDDGGQDCDSLDITLVHRFMGFCAYANEKDFQLEESAKLDCRIGGMDKIELKKESTVTGDVEGGDDVKLEENSKVGGTVYAAGKVELKKNAEIAGGYVENAEILYVTQVDVRVRARGLDKTVKKGGSMELPEGSYGKLTVKEGGILRLTDGRYSFKSIKVEKNATVEFVIDENEWTIIEVQKGIQFEEGAKIVTISGEATDILIKAGGNSVKLGKGAVILGTFIAPAAHIDMGEDAQLTGVLYAEKIQIKKSTDVAYAPALNAFIEEFLQ